MDAVEITRAMIAAGVDALALAGDTAADTIVQVIYHAMMQVAYEEASRACSRLYELGRRIVSN
jgi:hypothetical protein